MTLGGTGKPSFLPTPRKWKNKDLEFDAREIREGHSGIATRDRATKPNLSHSLNQKVSFILEFLRFIISDTMSTHPHATVIVHRVGIARSTSPQNQHAINTAKCRLCGKVIERKVGPLLVGIPGLYAESIINTAGLPTEEVKVWRVAEPFSDGMSMCS